MVSKRVVRTAKPELQQKYNAAKHLEKAWNSEDLLSALEPPPGLQEDSLRSELDCAGVLPPGLELPPGLKIPAGLCEKNILKVLDDVKGCKSLETSSGFHTAAACEDFTQSQLPAVEVCVTGLPNDILSDVMFEAVMQQAGLEGGVADYLTRPGDKSGEAIIRIYHPGAVDRCLNHFNGCQWLSGIKVSAEVVEYSPQSQLEASVPELPYQIHDRASEVSPLGSLWQGIGQAAPAPAKAPSSLLADLGEPQKILPVSTYNDLGAPAKIEISSMSTRKAAQIAKATKMPPSKSLSGQLSAEAPAFVPSSGSVQDRSDRRQGKQLGGQHANSEISTEIGESEGEDREVA
mmetsp:Transcript_60140/g.143336  ORF Transcript_60140/g.143336 Transcript_60140/m.143336 type:complete len:347 (-) Transcript_60140:210-1250(-)